jgi:hypothetical protein
MPRHVSQLPGLNMVFRSNVYENKGWSEIENGGRKM